MSPTPIWSRASLPVTLVAALALAACGNGAGGNGANGSGGGNSTGGEIFVSGSSTVEPITNRVAEAYAETNEDFFYTVEGPGTGDGFALFCNGETDMSDASRAISEEEATTCEENGVEYVELLIAYDGLSVITSAENDAVDCLSFLDLYALLGPESEGFDSWSDANDLAAELEGEFGTDFGESHAPYPDEPLSPTAPGEESGTFDSFVEIVIEGMAEERGTDPTTRPDYTASANDNVIIEGISGSPSSLGWVGYAFFVQNSDQVKALEVDGGQGCVESTDDTIASGEYPISRPLFIYVNTQRAQENEALRAFVDFYLSDEGRQAVADVGYVQLTDDAWSETVSAWENAL